MQFGHVQIRHDSSVSFFCLFDQADYSACYLELLSTIKAVLAGLKDPLIMLPW